MEIKKGIGVSPGVVISTALVLGAEELHIPQRHVEQKQVEQEVARLEAALLGRCLRPLHAPRFHQGQLQPRESATFSISTSRSCTTNRS